MLVARGNCVGVAEAAVEGGQPEPEVVDSMRTDAWGPWSTRIPQCCRHSRERSWKTTRSAPRHSGESCEASHGIGNVPGGGGGL
jgi:hypothetical protein